MLCSAVWWPVEPETAPSTAHYALKLRNICHFLIGLELSTQECSRMLVSEKSMVRWRGQTYFALWKIVGIIYWAEKYETTSPHYDFFFSIYIKFLKKIHPFLICKSPYSLGLGYFYLTWPSHLNVIVLSNTYVCTTSLLYLTMSSSVFEMYWVHVWCMNIEYMYSMFDNLDWTWVCGLVEVRVVGEESCGIEVNVWIW
jgi:hypothetical protein